MASVDSESVCRDFERGVCSRGGQCRYKHPEGVKPPENAKLPICKDFQNKGCGRIKCKFLHVTVTEEAEYMKTGDLPAHGGRRDKVLTGGKEICKDFLNGICDRRSSCKFAHTPDPAVATMYDPSPGKRFRGSYDVTVTGSAEDMMDENELLRRKITDLQKQVIELRQMNDTLYDQNTKYRTQLTSNRGNPMLA